LIDLALAIPKAF